MLMSFDYEKIIERFSLLLMIEIFISFVYVSNFSCIAGHSHPSHHERLPLEHIQASFHCRLSVLC